MGTRDRTTKWTALEHLNGMDMPKPVFMIARECPRLFLQKRVRIALYEERVDISSSSEFSRVWIHC